MSVVSAFFLFVLLAGFLAWPLPAYLVFVMPLFAAMSVLPPGLLGGTSFTPGSVAAFLLILRAVMKPGIFMGSVKSLLDLKRLGWLFCFFAVAAIGAVILPRLFAGEISVYGMRTLAYAPVEPSVPNFTQTGYLFISVAVAAVVCALVRRNPAFMDILLRAIFAGGCTVIATGLLDIAANATGHGDMLKIFYTADYGYSAGNILGARRVLGLTPEPSSFGGYAVGFAALLLFLRPYYSGRLRRRLVPAAGWGCALMAFLSESSTAYASMFLLLALYLFYGGGSVSETGTVTRKPVLRRLAPLFAVLGVVPLALLLDPGLAAPFADRVNALIFQKHDTTSYVERMNWTQAGLEAFVSSYGLGVGVGSVRTSNFFANILASTGLPGSILYVTFLVSLYLRRVPQGANSREQGILRAAKLALLPMFAGQFLAGTTPDFGVVPGIMFGVVTGLASPLTQKSRQGWRLSPHPPRQEAG